MQELLNILNNAKSSLDNYYEIYKSENLLNKRNTPKDYLEWVDKKTKIIINSPEFIGKSKEYIVRGNVVWVEFGFNIGEEFSGRHPAVVLKNGGKTLLVLPITSKQPTEKQLASKTYVELGKVYNFKTMRRLDNISKAFLESDLFKYLPSKNIS